MWKEKRIEVIKEEQKSMINPLEITMKKVYMQV